MNRKLIITRMNEHILTCVMENESIVEIHCNQPNEEGNVAELGNIYVGKVKHIAGNIRAAFIEIANGLECYYAIDDNPQPIFTNKIGKKPLCIGDELLVQVSKEAVKTKVPTVTGKLNLTGKYAILTYGDSRIGVSTKIKDDNRQRLQFLAQPYASDEYGFIIRTNAKDVADEVLQAELEQLSEEFERIVQTAQTRTSFSCLKQAPKSYLSDLKNVYQEGFTDIIVEDRDIYEEISKYLESEQPEDLEKLRLYEDQLLPLHKLYSIETCITNALKERVWLKSGAYLIIQPTEALTVIDVNTGKCVAKKADDNTYLKINIEAAREAARQIRLRNLSGIILVDFINLSSPEATNELLEVFRYELKKDPITTTLVDITKLQLVEITRKKVRKPLHEVLQK